MIVKNYKYNFSKYQKVKDNNPFAVVPKTVDNIGIKKKVYEESKHLPNETSN